MEQQGQQPAVMAALAHQQDIAALVSPNTREVGMHRCMPGGLKWPEVGVP